MYFFNMMIIRVNGCCTTSLKKWFLLFRHRKQWDEDSRSEGGHDRSSSIGYESWYD